MCLQMCVHACVNACVCGCVRVCASTPQTAVAVRWWALWSTDQKTLQANKPVRVSCPSVKDTHTYTQRHMPATQACTYVHNSSQAHVHILPVACGRVSDLLEYEQGVCVSSVTRFSSSSSVFTDSKHSVLTLYIDTNFMQRPLWCGAVFCWPALLVCISIWWFVCVVACRADSASC